MEQLYSVNASNFVLSSLLNNTDLLYNDKYPLNKNDFKPNLTHKIIFICICQLADKGCVEIDSKEIVTFLESGYTEQLNALKTDLTDGNIVGYINTLKQLDNTKSYEFWYNEVRKRSMLRLYRDQGFCIDKFWNEEGAIEKNIENLNKYSLKDIAVFFDTIQMNIKQNYIVDSMVRRIQAGVGFAEIKEALKETPYFGACIVSPYQSTLFRGWIKGQLLMNSSPSGFGKAQPVDTIIPTPNGNKRLGDIKVGDYVFDRCGKPTKVLGVYPQGVIDNYKVTLKDGRTTYCNNEHLWNVLTKGDNKRMTKKTVNTDYIANWLQEHIINGKRTATIYIPSSNAVEYSEKKFKIDPYVFGSFIGNGCCKEKELTISSSDIENVTEIARLIHAEPIKRRTDNYSWNFKILDNFDKEVRINNANMFNNYYHTKQFFNGYEDNIMCYSYEKSIPNEYKYSSVEQRYNLLQGLFDTDGCISYNSGRYTVSYTTTSAKLKDDILEILYSLGYSASIHEDKRKKYTNGVGYTISVLVDNEEKRKFFRISRKKKIAIEAGVYKNEKTRLRHYDRIPIVSVEKMPHPCEMVCIYVDNEEHLYLTNDYIVTHNTIRAVGELCNVCATRLWDFDKQCFVDNPNRQGAGLYINTEMDLELELTPCFVAYISGVSRGNIMDGIYDSVEQEARVDEAIKILEESKIFLVDDPNFTLRSIEENIKLYKENYDIQYMVFDYLQDNGIIGKEMKTTHEVVARDTIILNMATQFKVFAKQYNIGIYTMTQLNGNEKTADVIDESCLSGGKAVKFKLDCGCISLPPRKTERKLTEGLLLNWQSKHRGDETLTTLKPNVVLHNYKTRFGKAGIGVKIYQYLDKGTGRCIDMYCTTLYDEPINIDKTIAQ